ncbi:hypothetical protein BSF38_04619 [Paludisphaera borealis]|uniref:Uncharacterized protein n=1 Tax=Paludisphaera borealis TaxID=1387353 RepID=A0A1U7CVV9_9BACT|nr:hypothetical protein BSF38_04619 [Paludisphaera borealis]
MDAIFIVLVFVVFLRLCVAHLRWLTRKALQALSEWAKSEHIELIDIRPTKWKPPWFLPDRMRVFEICVVDSTGRKRRGRAVCGDPFWRISDRTVSVEWNADQDLE